VISRSLSIKSMPSEKVRICANISNCSCGVINHICLGSAVTFAIWTLASKNSVAGIGHENAGDLRIANIRLDPPITLNYESKKGSN